LTVLAVTEHVELGFAIELELDLLA